MTYISMLTLTRDFGFVHKLTKLVLSDINFKYLVILTLK